jgi:mRNA interferase MazF
VRRLRRGDIYWADFPPPVGTRPVLIVLRNGAIGRLNRIVVAPVSTHIRGLRSELALGQQEGLGRSSVAQCDSLQQVDKSLLSHRPVGHLGEMKVRALDRALRAALTIKCRR